MASRKSSMTLVDLELIRSIDQAAAFHNGTENTGKYHENSEIFEEICHEAEAEDRLYHQPSRHARRSSLGGIVEASPCAIKTVVDSRELVEITALRRRRHSTFNPRNRASHRRDHIDLEQHLNALEDKHSFRRASFVNNLLEFSVNYDVSTNAMGHEMSPALNFSCPVLSYMNDDEEDSVELRMLRRTSLVSSREDSKESSWESLKDDGETELPHDAHFETKEYVIELPAVEEFSKPRGQKRRAHSYKLLEQRLTSESQVKVIRSFSVTSMSASMQTSASQTPTQPKALDMDVTNTFYSHSSERPIAARQQCARGA